MTNILHFAHPRTNQPQQMRTARQRWRRQWLMNFMMWHEFAMVECASLLQEMDYEFLGEMK